MLIRRFKKLKSEIEEGNSKYTKLLEIDRKYQIFEWYNQPKNPKKIKKNIKTSPFVLRGQVKNSKILSKMDQPPVKKEKKIIEGKNNFFLKHETTSKFRPLSKRLRRRSSPERCKEICVKEPSKKMSEKILYMKKKFLRLYQETVMKIPLELEIRASGMKKKF